jgi:cytochrome c
MKPFATIGLITAFSAASLPALANLELATKNACTACHAVDKKVLGPSYQDVARKYASQKDAVAQISESVRKGGSGKWGAIPMPAQPALSDADLETLARWISGGAK